MENPQLKPTTRAELEEKLNWPIIPDDCDFIWNIYWELFNGERLSYQEIYAYALLEKIEFSPLDVRFIRAMDNTACSYVQKELKKKTKT